jgi:hypothetical protein
MLAATGGSESVATGGSLMYALDQGEINLIIKISFTING